MSYILTLIPKQLILNIVLVDYWGERLSWGITHFAEFEKWPFGVMEEFATCALIFKKLQ